MAGTRSPSPSAGGRTLDIELGSQEVISIDLDDLDPDPADLLDLLKEQQCKAWVWIKLAGEYWRRGSLDAAERIAATAVDSFHATESTASLPPIYALLANIQIAHARKAPKIILPNARQDDMSNEKSKDQYHGEASTYLNLSDKAVMEAGGEGSNRTLSFLTRGIQQLATRSLEDAFRSFDGVLAEKPTNLVALLGKARILYVRRQFPQALKVFQQVLQLNPHCIPDPRIGIGLCLWAMDHKAKAKAAWQRSVEVNPTEWPAHLLLGLESINASKTDAQSDAERTHLFVTGTKMIERAFNANQRSAAAANALCDVFLRKNQLKRAMKLAERTIQFADTITVLTEGYIRAGRVAHAEGSLADALKHFTAATQGQKSVLGSIGLAQMQLKNDEYAAAIHTLDTLVQPPNPQKSLEATVMLASLRGLSRPGVSSSDAAKERAQARELFDVVCKSLELHGHKPVSQANGHETANGNGSANGAPKRPQLGAHRRIAEDVDMHAEIARLWQAEDIGRTKRALGEAMRLAEAVGTKKADPRLVNNLAVVHHLEADHTEARALYERALTVASGDTVEREAGEEMATSILYNLARVYEDLGEDGMAKDAYEKLLSRHPEYVDAKIRQAHMLAEISRHNEAHDLLKQALTSQPTNLNVRAFYTHFLINANMSKIAKEFVFSTLKDHDKHDVYSLCAAGWIQYTQARESRDPSTKGIEERKRGFQRSAEFYEKALHLDAMCAVAAQGLAIVTAEDALGTLGGALPPGPSPDEAAKRSKNAREALDVFGKVRESVSDGSVYLNMGHCYYARDEFDRAIESYETASKRHYAGHNVTVLLCLCRSWYAKSTKDQSFPAMNTALQYAQQALHIQPHDKAILYNIAMIQQKAAEMLFSIPPAKRSLKDLQRAIEQAGHAQKLFASLAADKSHMVPYSLEIADQRRKYGESMLRKGDEHLATQRQYEAESRAKLDAARQKRQEDRDRQRQVEEERLASMRVAAEKLADERRVAREQAQEWTRDIKADSDEEREKKTKRASRKAAKADVSGDEGEPKKKKRGKKKANDGAEEEEALFSANEDEGDKPVKKRTKKRVVRDEDDEEGTGGPRRKPFKSRETIEDSDEEMS